MVLKFAVIPSHLQKHIAEMMNFYDFKPFHESSKQARAIGNISKPTMNIYALLISMDDIWINFRAEKKILWSNVKLQENCPRFSAHIVQVEELLTEERILEIINNAENGYLTAKKARLRFSDHDMVLKPKVFNRLLEVFNVDELYNVYVNASYMQLPSMKKISWFFLVPPIEEEILFSLRSPKISINLNTLDRNLAMNRFFKEWMNDEREIMEFDLGNYSIFSLFNAADIFSDMPHTILWNRSTPNSGLLMNLSLTEDEAYRVALILKSYFSIQNGKKTLFVAVGCTGIAVKEVVDAEKAFLDELNYEYFVNLYDRYDEYMRNL